MDTQQLEQDREQCQAEIRAWQRKLQEAQQAAQQATQQLAVWGGHLERINMYLARWGQAPAEGPALNGNTDKQTATNRQKERRAA